MKLTTYKRTNNKFSYTSHHYSNSVELHQLTVHEINCSKETNVIFTNKQSRFASSIRTSSYSDLLHKILDIEICKDANLIMEITTDS